MSEITQEVKAANEEAAEQEGEESEDDGEE